MMTDTNNTARHLVEAYFGLSPQARLTPEQKRVYPRLFHAARSLLELNIEHYGPNLHEAAGHLDKAAIQR